MKGETLTITRDEFGEMQSALNIISTENFKLSERLNNVDMMVDSSGWSPMYETGSDGGLTLGQLKASSVQLREMVVGNPFMKRGCQLRISYVLGNGVEFSKKSKVKGVVKVSDLPPRITTIMAHPRAQRYLFSGDAKEELERAAYTDGLVLATIHKDTKLPQRIALSQITADLRNPENPEEIWAYRRVWTKDPSAKNPVSIVRWYVTDIYEGKPFRTVMHGGKAEPVDMEHTIVDKAFNRQVGWAYGVPDSLPIIAWAKIYKEFLVNGYIMSKALAQIAYKVTVGSKKGGDNASLAIAKPAQNGSSYVQGEGNDLTALSSAGKGYDFASGRPIAAAMAAGIEVSLTALLGDAGSGSGGRAAEQTLDGPARATAAMRRKSWEEFWVRIFRLMGNTSDIEFTWHDLTEDQIQRRLQGWTQADSTGLFSGEVIQRGMANELGIADPGAIPEGRMLPNNEKSLARKDIDRDGKGGTNPNNTGTGTDGTGQGQDQPAGPLGNDHSTD